MKSVFVIAMFCGLLSSHALAQFTGPVHEGRVITVAEVREARWGSYVTVTGHIVARQHEDYYVFRDHTGEIRAEIEHRVWQGRAVNPQTRVQLHAEVDRGVGGRYLWVESLAVLE